MTSVSYLGNRICSGGRCEAAIKSRTRLRWVNSENAESYFAEENSYEDQRNCIQKLCEISIVLWK